MPTDDDRRIATNVYSFVPIAGIAGVEANKNIDVLAIIVNPGSAAVIKVCERASDRADAAQQLCVARSHVHTLVATGCRPFHRGRVCRCRRRLARTSRSAT